MTANDLHVLLKRIEAATGRDHRIDRDVAQSLARVARRREIPEYTASVDLCLALIDDLLPGWHWHLGYGANGVFPYASISHGHARFETQASTVPLALLAALVRARLSQIAG